MSRIFQLIVLLFILLLIVSSYYYLRSKSRLQVASPTPTPTPTVLPSAFAGTSPTADPTIAPTNNPEYPEQYPEPSPTPLGVTTLPETGVSSEKIVTLSENGFYPQSLNISRGQIVVWENDDTFAHNISITDKSTNEVLNIIGLINPNSSKGMLFSHEGRYLFFDNSYSRQNGIITVK